MPLFSCFTTDGHHHQPFVESVQGYRDPIDCAHITFVYHSVGSFLRPFSAVVDMTLVPLFILSS
jgi:hypothetical protein